MKASHPFRHSRGDTNYRNLIVVIAVVIILLLGAYLLRQQPEPVPDPGRPLQTVEPAKSGEERGDTAREIIAQLEERADEAAYAEAHSRAQGFMVEGRLADAQLLYFFAARGGHAPAAFDLATLNDPNHHSAASSLAPEADPFQAYRWYSAAQDAGHPGASQRLEELRAWAESASLSGDADAEQLLLQWEQGQ